MFVSLAIRISATSFFKLKKCWKMQAWGQKWAIHPNNHFLCYYLILWNCSSNTQKTHSLHFKDRSVNVVYVNNRRLFCEKYETRRKKWYIYLPLCFKSKITVTKQVGVAVTLKKCIREVLGSKLGTHFFARRSLVGWGGVGWGVFWKSYVVTLNWFWFLICQTSAV
jgi:hypothetical protein